MKCHELSDMSLEERLILVAKGARRALKDHSLLNDDLCGFGLKALKHLHNANIIRLIVKRWTKSHGKKHFIQVHLHFKVKDLNWPKSEGITHDEIAPQ